MAIIIGACFIALFLTIWFKTNAFVEYLSLLHLGKFFHIDEYQELDTTQSYPDFLKEYFNSFATKLLGCPVCLSVWLGFFVSIFTGFITYPAVVFLGLSAHLLISRLL